MIVLYGLQLTLIVGGLLWKTAQLARNPADRLLRVVVATLVAAAAGWTVNTINGRSGQPATSSNTVLLWIGHSLNPVIVCYGIACFYLIASQDDDSTAVRRGFRRRTALLLAALLIGGAAVFWPSATPRTETYDVYLVSNLYCGAALAATAVISSRYARSTETRFRIGLTAVGAGAGIVALGCTVKAVVVLVAWTSGRVFEPLSSIFGNAMQVGILIFMVGVLYPAAAARIVATRIWARHLREYRQLSPLWHALNDAYPEHTLRLPDEGTWARISPAGVHRRRHRRIVEIRDGLVHVSPYLGDLPSTDSDTLAAELRHALSQHALGELPQTNKAVPVAIPEQPGQRGEAATLIALSDALVRQDLQEAR